MGVRRSNPHTRRGYTEVKTFRFNGAAFEILLSTTNGSFTAWADTSWLEAKSLTTLQDKLRTYVRSTRSVSIPVTILDNFDASDTKLSIEDVTLCGNDARRGRPVYQDEDGHKDTMQHWETTVRRLTGPEKGEFAELVKAQWAAVKAVREWVEARSVSAVDLVTEANQALSTAPPSEDPAGDGSAELEDEEDEETADV